MITQLFPNKCNVYARGPVGENVLHTSMLLNTPSTLAIAKYLIKLYGPTLVNAPFTVRALACCFCDRLPLSVRVNRLRSTAGSREPEQRSEALSAASFCSRSQQMDTQRGEPAAGKASRQLDRRFRLPPFARLAAQDRKSPGDPPGSCEGQTALHIAIVNRCERRTGCWRMSRSLLAALQRAQEMATCSCRTTSCCAHAGYRPR